jgi:hypothetical protein
VQQRVHKTFPAATGAMPVGFGCRQPRVMGLNSTPIPLRGARLWLRIGLSR